MYKHHTKLLVNWCFKKHNTINVQLRCSACIYLLLNSNSFNWVLLVYLFCPLFIHKVLTRKDKTWQRKRSSHFKQYWLRSLGWYASYSSQTVQTMQRSVELNIAERCGKNRISPLEFFQLLLNQKQSHSKHKDWCEETNGHPDEYLPTPHCQVSEEEASNAKMQTHFCLQLYS